MPLRMLEAMEIVIILTFIKHLPSRVIRPHVGDQITQKNPRRKAQPQLVMKQTAKEAAVSEQSGKFSRRR